MIVIFMHNEDLVCEWVPTLVEPSTNDLPIYPTAEDLPHVV